MDKNLEKLFNKWNSNDLMFLELMFSIKKQFEEEMKMAIKADNLTLQDLKIIEKVLEYPGITISKLCQILNKSKPNISRSIKNMTGLNVLKLVEDKNDKRVKKVYIESWDYCFKINDLKLEIWDNILKKHNLTSTKIEQIVKILDQD